VQRLLGLCGLIPGAVAHHGVALGQVEVECDQGAVLQAQRPQGGTINLEHTNKYCSSIINIHCSFSQHLFLFLTVHVLFIYLFKWFHLPKTVDSI